MFETIDMTKPPSYIIGVGYYGKSIIEVVKDNLSAFKEDEFWHILKYTFVNTSVNINESIITEDSSVTIMIVDLDDKKSKEEIIDVAKKVRDKIYLSVCFLASNKKIDTNDEFISNLLEITNSIIPISKDELLSTYVSRFIEFYSLPNLMAVDLADIKNVMGGHKISYLGNGGASGENRAIDAADIALRDKNFLLSFKKPNKVICNIKSNLNLSQDEMYIVINRIKTKLSYNELIYLIVTFDINYKDAINVLIIATKD